MTKKEFKESLEKRIIEGCDSKEETLFVLSTLEALSSSIDRETETGKKMIHLLDGVNDTLQALGIVPENNTFYSMTVEAESY